MGKSYGIDVSVFEVDTETDVTKVFWSQSVARNWEQLENAETAAYQIMDRALWEDGNE